MSKVIEIESYIVEYKNCKGKYNQVYLYFGSMFTLEPAKNQRGVAKLIDNQRPPPRPKFNPNAPSRMPPPSLSNK